MKYLLSICLVLAGCNTRQVNEINGKYFCRIDTGTAHEAMAPIGALVAMRELPVANYLCKKAPQ